MTFNSTNFFYSLKMKTITSLNIKIFHFARNLDSLFWGITLFYFIGIVIDLQRTEMSAFSLSFFVLVYLACSSFKIEKDWLEDIKWGKNVYYLKCCLWSCLLNYPFVFFWRYEPTSIHFAASSLMSLLSWLLFLLVLTRMGKVFEEQYPSSSTKKTVIITELFILFLLGFVSCLGFYLLYDMTQVDEKDADIVLQILTEIINLLETKRGSFYIRLTLLVGILPFILPLYILSYMRNKMASEISEASY